MITKTHIKRIILGLMWSGVLYILFLAWTSEDLILSIILTVSGMFGMSIPTALHLGIEKWWNKLDD